MRISDQEFNRLRILKAIRRAEPVSRTELAALTGLAGGTITEITGELVRRKILVEERASAGGVGRPRMSLKLNAEAAFVVSASLPGDGTVAVEIVNARGDPLFGKAIPFTRQPTLEALTTRIGDAIDETIAASPIPKTAIHSVGLSLAGIVEGRSGLLHWLTTYPAPPFPIAARLQEQLGLPVLVDNGLNVFARGEHWFGGDRELDDFTFILFDVAVGLAQYVGGLLWGGVQGINPEFGHMKVGVREGRKCICGGEDCLTTHAGLFDLALQFGAAFEAGAPRLVDIVSACEAAAARALEGDVRSLARFEHVGRTLGEAVGGYINLCNPSRIIICTTAPTVAEVVRPFFDAAVHDAAMPVLRDRVSIQWRVREELSHREGAAALVLEQLYRVPTAPQLEAPARQAG